MLWTDAEAARAASVELTAGGGLSAAYRCLMQQDVDDILLLYGLCGFTTVAQGLDLVEAAYPARPIAPRVRFLLEEFLGGAGA